MSKEMSSSVDSGDQHKGLPKDAVVMGAILKEMGVNEYEPQVINQMLEFTYRYITTVLEEAKFLADHAQKSSIDADDVKLAISLTTEHSFSSPPPREFLLELAREKNSQPLPAVGEKFGVRLPPERYCLLANNYQIRKKGGKATSSRSGSVSHASSAQSILVPSNLSAIANMKSPIILANNTSILPQATTPPPPSLPSPKPAALLKANGQSPSPVTVPQTQTPSPVTLPLTQPDVSMTDEVGVMEDSGDSDEEQGDAVASSDVRRGVKRSHDDDEDYDNL